MYAVHVRAATLADVERIADVKVSNWADTYGPLLAPSTLRPFLDRPKQLESLRGAASQPGAVLLVAEEGGEVVGYALTFVDTEPEPWMESLHVLREFRSRGAGRLLMHATAEALIARGRRTLRLGVVEGNIPAARFYERLGAISAGREPAAWAPHVWHELYRWSDVESLRLPRR